MYTFTDPTPQRLPGCAREVTFSSTGCTAIDSNCNDYEGSATTQTVQEECGTSGNGGPITDEQFECAMDLCTPGISVPVGTENIKVER